MSQPGAGLSDIKLEILSQCFGDTGREIKNRKSKKNLSSQRSSKRSSIQFSQEIIACYYDQRDCVINISKERTVLGLKLQSPSRGSILKSQ
ncbi:hypothetical protein pb186bvf_013884 [Paramecium bursaria]